MKLKIAKKHLDDKKSDTLSFKDIEKKLKDEASQIFYFDRDNSHKDLVDLVEKLEDKDFSVYLKEVKYGLDENDYIYEVHVL